MVNHPTRKRGPYTAQIGGHSLAQSSTVEFATIRECRAWAEEYGTTADYCAIYDRNGNEIASHRRDTSGRGDRWYRAYIQ